MTRDLVTHFDRAYLAKGLALLRSIEKHLGQDWRVFVLALDDLTFDAVSYAYRANGRVTVLPLRAVETTLIRDTRDTRTWREYIFTLTPIWAQYVMAHYEVKRLAYIDADCYFYADPAPIYDEVETALASIGIIPHRWTPRHATRLQKNGEFNVGWVYLVNDPIGRACLDDWGARCLAWRPPYRTSDQIRQGLDQPFSDQIYLNEWPSVYGSAVRIIKHLGANLAPWSQEQYHYRFNGGQVLIRDPKHLNVDYKGVLVDQWDPLLFYHFHELRQDGKDGQIYRTGYPLTQVVADHVYGPYEKDLADAARSLTIA